MHCSLLSPDLKRISSQPHFADRDVHIFVPHDCKTEQTTGSFWYQILNTSVQTWPSSRLAELVFKIYLAPGHVVSLIFYVWKDERLFFAVVKTLIDILLGGQDIY